MIAVADTGLGKDMWTLPFKNITHILYVSKINMFSSRLRLTSIRYT